jgi:hypothetical protein
LNELLDKNKNDFKKAFDEYSEVRKPSCDAICELSKNNMVEMSSKTASKFFLFSKKIEMFLSNFIPDYIPLYSMVVFSPNLSYRFFILLIFRSSLG